MKGKRPTKSTIKKSMRESDTNESSYNPININYDMKYFTRII